jgi:tol-pal system protein YbgF
LKKLLIFSFILLISADSFSEEHSSELLLQKIESLQKEVESLRNLVEENAYLIERYQELQQQRYLDLDKRLHDILSSELSNIDNENLEIFSVEGESNQSTLSMEIDVYRNALELFDSSRYAQALQKFRELIVSFPEGKYIADAYFWSGELYLAQKQNEDARENYLVVVRKYINHNRAPDSLYKLGLIEKLLGNTEDEKEYFLKLIKEYPNTGAAELAKKSLEISSEKSN